jgi:AraC-like DNA-binding protein
MEKLNIELDFLYFIISPLVLFGVILGISFLKNSLSDLASGIMLALVFFITSYVYLIDYLFLTGAVVHFPHLIRTNTPFNLLVYPLIYLIAFKNLGKRVSLQNSFFHFVPFLISILNLIPFWLSSATVKLALIEQGDVFEAWLGRNDGYFISGQWIGAFRIVQLQFYLILMIILMSQNKSALKANTRVAALIQSLFIYVVAKNLIAGYVLIFDPIFDFQSFIVITKLRVSTAFLFLVSFFLRPQILLADLFLKKNESADPVVFKEVLNEFDSNSKLLLLNSPVSLKNYSKLSPIEKKRWLIIVSYLKEKSPYLDHDFSIKKLEEEIKISSKLIGKIVKTLFDDNFNQFINQLRIEHALLQLGEDPKWRSYTVEALASNVGFNSTNSFYGYFKEHTGKTPREYILDLEFRY